MELHAVLKNIFPFDKNPKFTLTGYVDKPGELQVKCVGSVKQINQWTRILGLKSPIEFVSFYAFSNNKVAKELNVHNLSAEVWGWTSMNAEFQGDMCTLTLTSTFFEMQHVLDLLTKQGHVIAGLYLDAEVAMLILDEET